MRPLVAVSLLALALCGASRSAAQSPEMGTAEIRPFDYAAPEDVGLSADAVGGLSVQLAEWVRNGDLVGAEVLLVKDRRIVLHDVVGWSDRDAGLPLRLNSVYHVASMTKPFTGTAVLMLAEEGLLDLEAPVAAWLPSWNTPASRGITVRELLTHTAGWANEGPGPDTPLSGYPGVRALADRVGSEGPTYPPGETFRYGDAHSYTLAALVEEASGIPVEAFVRERILEPLGLVDTRLVFRRESPWDRRVNPTYRREGDVWVPSWSPVEGSRVPYFYGAGGMYSTAMDYARWLDAWMYWLDGDSGPVPKLLDTEMARRAVAPGELHPGYGFHWYVYATDPLVFGHGGSDGTRAYAVPSERAFLIILTQSRQAPVRARWPDLLESVLDDVVLAPELPEVSAADFGATPVALDAAEYRAFLGEYVVDSDTISVVERDGRLHLRTGFWRPYDLVPLGDGWFAMGTYDGGELARIAAPEARVQFLPTGVRAQRLRLVLVSEGRVDFEAERIR